MTRHFCTVVVGLFSAVLLSGAPLLPSRPERSKIIDLSWSVPSVDYYVKNLAVLEQHAPLDGLVIDVTGKTRTVNGKSFRPGSRTPMGKIAWSYEDFQGAIAKLKGCRSEKFTDNFFYTVVSPGDIDWFSDEDWQSVVNNYGLAARIAKETGMKGLLVDIEEYGKKFWQFKSGDSGRSLAEARTIARLRGQQWGRAVFGAFPEGRHIFLHFINMAMVATSLSGPFFDGMFDVLPPETVLFDGQESTTYGARNALAFDASYRNMARTMPCFLAEENRRKYRAQVRLAPAFYMDAIFPENPESRYHQMLRPDIEDGALEFFRRNLIYAMERAEGYIWLYGEKGCWWPNSSSAKAQTLWDERAPGAARAVELVRSPDKFPVDKTQNLVKHALWSFWQEEDEQKGVPKPGKGTKGADQLQLCGLNSGCFAQSCPVKPGEIYLFRASFRLDNEAAGSGSIQVCFKDGHGKWLKERQTVQFNPARAGEWVTETVVAIVPPTATVASIQLGAYGQRKDDVVSFKDAVFVKAFD